jgi:hypothetical protein
MVDYFKNVHRVFDPINNKVTKYEWGKEVAPGITALGGRSMEVIRVRITDAGRRALAELRWP